VPRGLGVRHEHVKLDLGAGSEARRCGQVHAGVADRGRDAGKGARLVVDLDDQVVRDPGTLSQRERPQRHRPLDAEG
jgi:hypothetical protein